MALPSSPVCHSDYLSIFQIFFPWCSSCTITASTICVVSGNDNHLLKLFFSEAKDPMTNTRSRSVQEIYVGTSSQLNPSLNPPPNLSINPPLDPSLNLQPNPPPNPQPNPSLNPHSNSPPNPQQTPRYNIFR